MKSPNLTSPTTPEAPQMAPTDMSGPDTLPPVLLAEDEVQGRVNALAELMVDYIKPGCVGVCLLTGGIWFAADLSRALNKNGKDIAFDALWMSSYGDGHQSGTMVIRAPLQRPVEGRQVLIMDDVLDSGTSLQVACDILLKAGATEVLTAVFASKPDPLKDGKKRTIEADFTAWEAPARYLVGYGLDDGGRFRALPYIGALD